MNKINSVFIDNLSLQANGDVPSDLPADRVAGKDGGEIVARNEMVMFHWQDQSVARRRANGMMSIERARHDECRRW